VSANFKTISIRALALQALYQSFGFRIGSWGFSNVLANELIKLEK